MMLKSLLVVGIGLLATNVLGQESLTLKKISATGVITIGYRDESIPFSYLDDKQRPIGYSMDLCYRIVDAVKAKLNLGELQVKLTPVTPATRIPLVANNIVDLECGTTTNNLDRQKQVSFVVTTFVASIRWMFKRSAQIDSMNDLKGKTVVSTAGTTSIQQLVKINALHRLQMNILASQDHAKSFQMIESDRAVAFAMDDVLIHGLIAMAKRPSDYAVSDDEWSVEPYGIVVRKGDPEFKKIADEAIIGLFRSGEINAIYRRWFQSPIPPQQVNLRLPMSAAFKKATAHPTDSGNPADYR